jgi:hypothetical protein
MKKLEYTFIDKSKWARGEWDSEPDKVQWPDPKTELPCLAVRNPHMGHWCGYVGVTEGHPFFGKQADDDDFAIDTALVSHGGITLTTFCVDDPARKEHGICHMVEEGEDDRVWWLGFDCGHCDDLIPIVSSRLHIPGAKYRNLAYVKDICTVMAAQLATYTSHVERDTSD